MRPWRELTHDGVVAAALREVEVQESSLDGVVVHAPAIDADRVAADSIDETVAAACRQLSALRSEPVTALEFFAVQMDGGNSAVVVGHRDGAPGAGLRSPGVTALTNEVPVADRVLSPATRSTFFSAARPWDSIYDGRSSEEFCLELPGLDATCGGAGRGAQINFAAVVRDVASLTRDRRLALWFVHAPAMPPGARDTVRRMNRSCVRVGVSLPSQLRERTSFAAELATGLAELGVGLYMRQPPEGGSRLDYWARITSASAATERARDNLSSWVDDNASRLTAIGPARPGVTAHIVESIERCGYTLQGLSMTSLQGLAIVHLVAGRPGAGPERALMAPSVHRCPIDRALGLQPHSGGCPTEDYQVVVSADHLTVPVGAGASGVWLVWSIDPDDHALVASLGRARAALESASASHRIGGPISFEYLIGRVSPQGRLRCRARVAIGPGAASPPTTGEMGQFCSDVERFWRREMLSQLSGRPFELEVVWRESWIGRSSSLHGPADG